jgi:hypothetical protein
VRDADLPPLDSKLASDYDSRFEKTVTQLIDEIQKRRYFISVDWIEDDSDDEDEIEGRAAAVKDKKDEQAPIRLLDYACGTGLVSRVRFFPPSRRPLCSRLASLSRPRSPPARP